METSVTQRIKELIKKKGETDTSFSKKIGISQSTLSCQMRSVKGIGIEVVIATLNTFHDISAEWLLRGKGEMLFDEDMPKFEGTENEEEENLKIEISKIRAEKEELLTANLTLKEELIKKTGYIEGQQDFISKLIIENNILSQKISEASKKDII